MKRSALRRTGGLRRTPPRRSDPDAVEAFFAAVLTVPSSATSTVTGEPYRKPRRCSLCSRRAVDPHHVLPKQFIRSICTSLDIDPEPWVWDPRNGMALCRHCHEGHESGHKRIPRWRLPDSVWVFVREIDALAGTEAASVKIEQTYPT